MYRDALKSSPLLQCCGNNIRDRKREKEEKKTGVDWMAVPAVRDVEAPAASASRVLAGGALRAAAAGRACV